MPSTAPPSDEPLSKGTLLVSIRTAVQDIWGDDGWRHTVKRLPADAAAVAAGAELTALTWYPTRYVMAWEQAIYDGVSANDEAAFRRYLRRSTDFGFGRIRRTFLRFVTPDKLAERAPELWAHDHSTGKLSVEDRSEGRAKLVLRGHPFVDSRLHRMAFAEVSRYIVSLSRIPNVHEQHEHVGSAVVVQLTWDA
jgi:hypothetical protein